jgi:6-phosphogluconate dehydrogenase
MQLAMIGLGRMGGNMVRRLLRGGHALTVWDQNPDAIHELESLGATAARDLADLCGRLAMPRAIWMMVPSGVAVDDTIAQLLPHLSPDDVLLDGGNSNYYDTIRRGQGLRGYGIHYVDVGTSGGIWGLENGYCLMIGGPGDAIERCWPVFETLAPAGGFAHMGPSGAGHYVKMIHNGIEYGLLQAYAEGYEILHASKHYDLDLHQIARLWNQGSVVRSWINELAERAFSEDPDLASIRGYVEDSGEGRWTIREAMACDVPAPVITLALQMRLRSRQEDSFGAKVIAALRNQFGGHAVKRA